jgi:hypothetical protein
MKGFAVCRLGALGTIMAANVAHVIIPGQRELVRAKQEGRQPDERFSLAAKQRSATASHSPANRAIEGHASRQRHWHDRGGARANRSLDARRGENGLKTVLFLGAVLLAAAAQAQPLSSAELEMLSRFDREHGFAGMPRQFRESEAPRVERGYAAARAEFAGQGPRIAEHYLRHTGTPPAAGAYFFVLEAVADAETAFALIRGLMEPPPPDTGPEFESGGRRRRLPRYEGEIETALEAVLAADAVARDPRVARTLVEAVAAMRAKGMATRAVALLAKCNSEEAREALRRLAGDRDSAIRAAAVAALGAAGAAPDAALLARALLEDQEPRARSEAAGAIARLQARDALPALRRALAEERNPEVTDAVVQALAALKALPDDPQQCFDAAARSWEAHAAALAFGCWRAQASREALLQAALEAPHAVRALAMTALFERPAAGELPLVRFPQAAVPAPPAPPGARASIARVPQPQAPAPAPPAFDDPTRRRLLESAVQVLSRAARAYPPRPETISPSLAYQMNSLLFDVAGGDMRLALQYADRIATRASRSINDGRLAASDALWRSDARAYETLRRPRQAMLAAALAACALLLLAFPQARAAGVAAALPLAAWALSTLGIGGVRELPPLALAPLTIVGSASIVAAITAAAAMLLRSRGLAPGWTGALLLGAGAIGVAAVAAFFVCGATRWYDVFPIMSEGWELIFDPIGAALAAVPLAALGFAGGAAIK